MKLTAPKQVTFWVGVAFALLGLLAQTGTFSILPFDPFYQLFIGFVILALGNLVKGL